MTSATALPSSSNSTSSSKDLTHFTPYEQIQSIVNKILSGKDVTTKADLKVLDNALQQLHVKKRNKDATDLQNDTFDNFVPFADRKFLQSCASNPPTLVRFVGMVQDMMDPEYYVSKVDGVYTKYRDYYSAQEDDGQQLILEEDHITMSQMLEERQPLVIVPIPNTSPWFRERIAPRGDGRMMMMMKEEEELDCDKDTKDRKSKKRSLDMDSSWNGTDSSCSTSNHQSDAQQRSRSIHSSVNNKNLIDESDKDTDESKNQDCDWWPKGCLGSDPDHGPVLAKMYYEEDQKQARLQLNDLVEMYGILSMDPLGASFHDQRRRDARDTGAATSIADIYEMEDAFLNDFMSPLAIPPPSRLPRLHVLQYKTLDLDKDLNDKGRSLDKPQDADDGDEVYHRHDRQLTIDTFASYLFQGNKVAAEALLMTLMSLAERDHFHTNKPKSLPSGTTLGCASVNFVLPSPGACQSLYYRLCSLLESVTPVLASGNLTIPVVNGTGNKNQIVSPTKNDVNRLESSLMQLPKASCFVLNQGSIREGVVNQNGHKTLASLAKMTSNHIVPYRFNGLTDIDFEADLRIIVLSSSNASSSGQGSKLLPCTMSMKTGHPSTADLDNISSETISRIRQYLSLCRHSTGSITLSEELLRRAQHDFVERRQKFRGASEENTIGEFDFHRWLTLTRLQARSRFAENSSNLANISDWEMALELDHKMRY